MSSDIDSARAGLLKDPELKTDQANEDRSSEGQSLVGEIDALLKPSADPQNEANTGGGNDYEDDDAGDVAGSRDVQGEAGDEGDAGDDSSAADDDADEYRFSGPTSTPDVGLNEQLVHIAVTQAGMSQQELAQFTTNDQLLGALRMKAAQLDTEGVEANEEEPEIEIPEIKDEDVEPWVVQQNKALRAVVELNKKLRDEVKELKKSSTDTEAMRQQQQHASNVAAFEREINSMASDPEIGKLVGQGDLNDFAPNSEEYKNRVALWERVKVLNRGYEGRASVKRLVREAAALEFEKTIQQSAVKKRDAKMRKRGKQMTVPPTHRKGEAPEQSPRDAAVSEIKDMFARNGWD